MNNWRSNTPSDEPKKEIWQSSRQQSRVQDDNKNPPRPKNNINVDNRSQRSDNRDNRDNRNNDNRNNRNNNRPYRPSFDNDKPNNDFPSMSKTEQISDNQSNNWVNMVNQSNAQNKINKPKQRDVGNYSRQNNVGPIGNIIKPIINQKHPREKFLPDNIVQDTFEFINKKEMEEEDRYWDEKYNEEYHEDIDIVDDGGVDIVIDDK